MDNTKAIARSCMQMLLDFARDNDCKPEEINLCLQIDDDKFIYTIQITADVKI